MLDKFPQIVETNLWALGPLEYYEDGGTVASNLQGQAGFQVVIDGGQNGNHWDQTPGMSCLDGRIQIQYNYCRR